MASIAERLATDPEYAERVRRAHNSEAWTWADEAAGGFRETGGDAGDLDDFESHARIDEVRVVAQALAFRRADAADAVELTSVILKGYDGENSGRPEGFRTAPILDVETVEAMIGDPDCHWILVGCAAAMRGGTHCCSISHSSLGHCAPSSELIYRAAPPPLCCCVRVGRVGPAV